MYMDKDFLEKIYLFIFWGLMLTIRSSRRVGQRNPLNIELVYFLLNIFIYLDD